MCRPQSGDGYCMLILPVSVMTASTRSFCYVSSCCCCCCCCCCARFWLLQSLKDPIVASILGIHFIPRCKMVSLGAVLTLVSHVVVHSALAVKAKQHPPDRPDRAERAFDGRGGGKGRLLCRRQPRKMVPRIPVTQCIPPQAPPKFFFVCVVGRFTPMVL